MAFALIDTNVETVACFPADEREGFDVMLVWLGVVKLPDALHITFIIIYNRSKAPKERGQKYKLLKTKRRRTLTF